MTAQVSQEQWSGLGHGGPPDEHLELVSDQPATTSFATQSVPETQQALLLHAAKQPYELVDTHKVPSSLSKHEVLVRTVAIGLNPIDWKAPYVQP